MSLDSIDTILGVTILSFMWRVLSIELKKLFTLKDTPLLSSTPSTTFGYISDFINSDTDGVLTFLLAPSEEENQSIILSREGYGGGSLLEGVLNGEPNFVQGIDGRSMEFDGFDDSLYTEAYFVLDTAYDELSVFAWVKSGGPGQVILSQSNRFRNWLYADPANGCLTTELRHDLDSDLPLLSQAVITDGQWHHVGLVWDGSYRTLYVDDIAVASDEQESVGASNGRLNIGTGKGYFGSDGGWHPDSGSYWSGLIDDVRIYDRAVTP